MQFVPDGLAALPPLKLTMANAGSEPPDMSKMLEGQLKPGIHIVVVTAVDTDVYTPAGPPVQTYETRVSLIGNGDGRPTIRRRAPRRRRDRRSRRRSAPPVISPRGTSVVNESGRFVSPPLPATRW